MFIAAVRTLEIDVMCKLIKIYSDMLKSSFTRFSRLA